MGRSLTQLWRTGAVAVLLASTVAACALGPSSAPRSPRPAPSEATLLLTTGVAAVDGELEIVLVDAAGKTLYYHTPDRVGHVTCTDATECADNWPPLKLPTKNAQVVGGPRLAGTRAPHAAQRPSDHVV